jgi:sterol desaturase/sphingolipid hydroxylase (fatty acid hydroxylase superfamily)
MLDLQGLVSHFNVNIRAGWLNYIFTGTESHRNHHSANMEETQNYGTTLAILDNLLFRSWMY